MRGGEMSVRSRPRRDLAASFNKMRRMVGDIKSARKSMAAHHSFMTELVSVSLFPTVPSSKASSPQSPPYHLQLDDSQEVGNGSMTLQSPVLRSAPPLRNLAKPRPRSPPCNLQLDDLQEVGIGSPLLQLDDSREMLCITSSILHSPIPCSVLPANPTLSSLRLLASRISTSLPPSVGSSHVQASCTSPSQLSCSTLEEVESGSTKIFSHSFAAYPGKLTAQPAFWASLLSAFLCLFLCIGKEVAVAVTITAYFIIWLTLKGRSCVKQISRYIFPCHSAECYIQDNQSRHLNRRWTIPTHGSAVLLSSSESHFCTSSQSLSTIHGCPQEEVYTSEPGLSTYSAPSVGSLSNAGIHSANLKLGIMLVLALCGLAHGQILAVCMCSCCVLMFSEMQRSASKRCKQEIQNNIQCSC